VATDGQDALDFLCRRRSHQAAPRPSLILLDLNLPGIGGHEVLSELKHDANLRQIPVIVLSSLDRIEDVGRAYELHANCYVQKPSDLEEFSHVIRIIENFWMQVVELTSAAR
jgi:chemotaxis family two-component system response regulator Rcp1